MAVEERRRAALFERLEHAIGPDATDTLFSMLPPSGHTVATTADLDRLGTELRAEMVELRTDLRVEMAALRVELAEGLAQQTRTLLVGLVGTLLSAAALAAALARFLA